MGRTKHNVDAVLQGDAGNWGDLEGSTAELAASRKASLPGPCDASRWRPVLMSPQLGLQPLPQPGLQDRGHPNGPSSSLLLGLLVLRLPLSRRLLRHLRRRCGSNRRLLRQRERSAHHLRRVAHVSQALDTNTTKLTAGSTTPTLTPPRVSSAASPMQA